MDDRPAFPLANLLTLSDGSQAEWEAQGHGSPLLWIEGGPGLPAHLARPELELLADRFRGHLVNAPGCGRSSPPAGGDYGLDTHVRYFDAVRTELGLGRVTVMGHSWGGLVALALALANPEAIDGVVVIDGYAGESSVPDELAINERDRVFDRVRSTRWFERAWAQFLVDGSNETGRELDERFRDCWPLYFADPTVEPARSHVERLGRETRWNIDADRAWTHEPQLDLRPELARLTVPVLVLVGELDFICGPVWARAIAEAAPNAALHVFAGVGHLPQYEAPEEFRRVVFDWADRRAMRRPI